jgi:hypothetical protein
VMQPDPAALENYDPRGSYERGESVSPLTGTSRVSWNDKAWVVGVTVGKTSKAYDWNRLKKRRVVNDFLGGVPIVIALSKDEASFVAFERPSRPARFTIDDDVLTADERSYDLAGHELGDASHRLKPIQAHQEFWHSWRTFHPDTLRQGE